MKCRRCGHLGVQVFQDYVRTASTVYSELETPPPRVSAEKEVVRYTCDSCGSTWTPEETTLNKALRRYGPQAQLHKLTEELAELIVAVQHLYDPNRDRGEDALQALAEEVADVEVMLTQLRYIYPFLNEVVPMQRSIKVERLRQRLAQPKE